MLNFKVINVFFQYKKRKLRNERCQKNYTGEAVVKIFRVQKKPPELGFGVSMLN